MGALHGILRCLVAALLTAAAACAPALAYAGEAKALLWRIERGGLEPSYLFGTIHLSLPDIVAISPTVRAALLEADLMMGEGVPKAAFEAVYMAELHTARPEERAALVLDTDALARLVAAAECYGLTPDQVRPAPLWLLVPLLALMLLHTARGELERQRAGALPLDWTLARIAADAGKLTLWIESPRQQIGFFKDMPKSDLVGIMAEVARLDECPPDDAADPALDLYRARDIDGLLALLDDWQEEVSDPRLWRRFMDMLLAQRNHGMADRIEALAQASSVFVAVGAGHLPGEEGLIALLRDRGWTVVPVE